MGMNVTKPCLICNRFLHSATGDWDTLQPHEGGEMRLIFSYGSTQFDLHPHCTEYRGIICDNCAAKLIPHMRSTEADD